MNLPNRLTGIHTPIVQKFRRNDTNAQRAIAKFRRNDTNAQRVIEEFRRNDTNAQYVFGPFRRNDSKCALRKAIIPAVG